MNPKVYEFESRICEAEKKGGAYVIFPLVLPCGNNDEFITCSLRQCCVVVSQRCNRIASFLRLALTKISGADIHRYFRKAVLDIRTEFGRGRVKVHVTKEIRGKIGKNPVDIVRVTVQERE